MSVGVRGGKCVPGVVKCVLGLRLDRLGTDMISYEKFNETSFLNGSQGPGIGLIPISAP